MLNTKALFSILNTIVFEKEPFIKINYMIKLLFPTQAWIKLHKSKLFLPYNKKQRKENDIKPYTLFFLIKCNIY